MGSSKYLAATSYLTSNSGVQSSTSGLDSMCVPSTFIRRTSVFPLSLLPPLPINVLLLLLLLCPTHQIISRLNVYTSRWWVGGCCLPACHQTYNVYRRHPCSHALYHGAGDQQQQQQQRLNRNKEHVPRSAIQVDYTLLSLSVNCCPGTLLFLPGGFSRALTLHSRSIYIYIYVYSFDGPGRGSR